MKGKSGFFAERRLNGIIGAMCYISAVVSGIIFVTVPGELYVHGADRAWFVVGILLGLSLSWLFIPVKLNDYCIKTGEISLPGFLSKRYKEKRRTVRTIITFIIAGSTLIHAAWLVSDGAKAIVMFTGEYIQYEAAVFAIVVFIMLYVIPFGFAGINRVGCISFVLMVLVFLALPALIMTAMGGHGFVAGISSSRPGCTVSDFLNITKTGTERIALSSVIDRLTGGMAFFVLPVLILYYTTYKSEKKLLLSRRFSVSVVLVIMVSACVIGVMGRAYLAPKVYISGDNPGMNIYKELIDKLGTQGLLPFALRVVMYAVLVAAFVSTADKCVYVASSAVSDEICEALNAKSRSRSGKSVQRLISFIALAAVAAASILLNGRLKSLSGLSLEVVAVTLGPVLIAALYAKRMNKQGLIAGVLAGVVMLAAWKLTGLESMTGINGMPAGFAFNLLVAVLCSLITKGPGEEVDKEFEDVKYGLID